MVNTITNNILNMVLTSVDRTPKNLTLVAKSEKSNPYSVCNVATYIQKEELHSFMDILISERDITKKNKPLTRKEIADNLMIKGMASSPEEAKIIATELVFQDFITRIVKEALKSDYSFWDPSVDLRLKTSTEEFIKACNKDQQKTLIQNLIQKLIEKNNSSEETTIVSEEETVEACNTEKQTTTKQHLFSCKEINRHINELSLTEQEKLIIKLAENIFIPQETIESIGLSMQEESCRIENQLTTDAGNTENIATKKINDIVEYFCSSENLEDKSAMVLIDHLFSTPEYEEFAANKLCEHIIEKNNDIPATQITKKSKSMHFSITAENSVFIKAGAAAILPIQPTIFFKTGAGHKINSITKVREVEAHLQELLCQFVKETAKNPTKISKDVIATILELYNYLSLNCNLIYSEMIFYIPAYVITMLDVCATCYENQSYEILQILLSELKIFSASKSLEDIGARFITLKSMFAEVLTGEGVDFDDLMQTHIFNAFNYYYNHSTKHPKKSENISSARQILDKGKKSIAQA